MNSAGPASQTPSVDTEQITEAACGQTLPIDPQVLSIAPEPGKAAGEFVPDQPVADFGEQAHREREVHPDPGWQITQPLLDRSRLCQHSVHQLERHHGGQLSQVARGEPARGHGHRSGDGRQSRRQGKMNPQRSSSRTSCLGRLPVPTSSVVFSPRNLNGLAGPANASYPALGEALLGLCSRLHGRWFGLTCRNSWLPWDGLGDGRASIRRNGHSRRLYMPSYQRNQRLDQHRHPCEDQEAR